MLLANAIAAVETKVRAAFLHVNSMATPIWLAFLEHLKHKAAVLFIVSVLASGVFRMLAPDSRKTDVSTDYGPQVASILAGRWFVAPDGAPLDRYPPLFPTLLAGTYRAADALSLDRPTAVFVMSAALIATAAIVLFALAQLFLAESTAFLAALLFASHPHILLGSLMPLSETPFMALLFASVFFLLKAFSNKPERDQYRYALGSGLLLGLSMLTRPIALFLPLVFISSIVLWGQAQRRKKALFCGAFVLAVLIVVSPWEAFIYSRAHQVVLLSSAGAAGMRDGLSFNNKTFRESLSLPKDVEELSNEAWARYQNFESPKDVVGFLWDKLRQKPQAVLQLFGLKATRAWFGTDSQNHGLELMNKLLLLIYMPPIIAGLVFYWRDRAADPALPKVVLTLVCYFWLMTILVLSIARYMVPAMSLLLVFIPYLLERHIRSVRGPLVRGPPPLPREG